MLQTRWVLLKVTLNDGQVEQADLVDGGIEEFIAKEIEWLDESFDTVSILEITDEFDHKAFEG